MCTSGLGGGREAAAAAAHGGLAGARDRHGSEGPSAAHLPFRESALEALQSEGAASCLRKYPNITRERTPTLILSLQPRGGWARGINEPGPDSNYAPDRASPDAAGVGGSAVCWEQKLGAFAASNGPVEAPREQHGGDKLAALHTRDMEGEEPKVSTAKFGCPMTVPYTVSCSAGGRFPSVKITLFRLFSQFCKSYC